MVVGQPVYKNELRLKLTVTSYTHSIRRRMVATLEKVGMSCIVIAYIRKSATYI